MNAIVTPVAREKTRESNIELLRIIAMVLVMVAHASFKSLGVPTTEDFWGQPVSTFLRVLSQSASIICVDLFILISGWFGIHAKAVRFSEFLFQVYFWGALMYLVLFLMGHANAMGVKGWMSLFMVRERWFIKAYIVLYIFAPVLNAFVEKSGEKPLRWFLIFFFTIQTLHGFIDDSSWFSCGYSPLSFMGLYLLARYMRLYPNRLTHLGMPAQMGMYVVLALLNTGLCLILISAGHGTWRLFAYSSPVVILQAVCFFLFFTKLHFKSRVVNWIAISSFAAYLLHGNVHFFDSFYVGIIRSWFESEPTVTFLLYTSAWIALLFMAAIVVDKLRIALWDWGLRMVKRLSGLRA